MTQDNSVVSLRPQNAIDQQAARWLAKLDRGNLTRAERAQFKQWMAADIKHAEALRLMADIWHEMGALLNHCHDDEVELGLSSQVASSVKLASVLAVAASVVLLSWWLWLAPMMSAEKNNFATLTGEQLKTTLTDGSLVHLNTNSVIETAFSKQQRIVRLLHGEALFDVAHDAKRPFIVYAGKRQVQALGTRFVVYLDQQKLAVTVTDGKVQLSTTDNVEATQTLVLHKGEQAFAQQGQAAQRVAVDLGQVQNSDLSWLNGKLVFDNEELVAVLAEINRYLPASLVVQDDALKTLRISGRFDLGDAEALVEGIELSLNLESKRINNEIHLVKKL